MINALTYLTRRCPNKCTYCRISREKVQEMSVKQWNKAWDILKEMGVTFNLILGNEPWMLGRELPKIMLNNEIPFAMYTSCNTMLYTAYQRDYFNSFLDNFSCAVDYSKQYLNNINPIKMNDMERKSDNAWFLLRCVREDYPKVDCQGLITIHRKNLEQVPFIVRDLSDMGVFVGVNLIHHARDTQTDFAPPLEEISDLVFCNEDIENLQLIFDTVRQMPNTLVMNPDYLEYDAYDLINKDYHCHGNPYGGPTIDADGSLRCCGYRKGKRTSTFNIFDLPKKYDSWKDAVNQDAMECAGCSWGYMLMYHTLLDNPEWGKKVFTKHAIKGLEESKWSKRKIE